MSFDSVEKSTCSSEPYELYQFSTTGLNYYLTSADQDLIYAGNTFSKVTIRRTEIEQSQERSSGEIKIYLPPTHPLATMFIPYLPPSDVALTIYGGHYSDAETKVIFVGTIAAARFTPEGEAELRCVCDQDDLKRRIPILLYQSSCPHVFGDAFCKFPLATVTYPGVVAAVDSTKSVVTVAAFASTPFSLKGGYLKRGNDFRLIVDHVGSVVTLMNGIAGLAVGDQVSGVAGCAHNYAACSAYSNVDNYLGFDLIPARNPFSGSLE